MNKREVVRILQEISLLLELKGENPFKARAYVQAARSLEAVPEEMEDLVASGRLGELPGIGEALRKKIATLVAEGSLPYHQELRAAFPAGLFELLRIPGLGPRKVRSIREHLGVATLGELEYACHENRLVDLAGFGPKSQEKILEGIAALKKHRSRFHCDAALREGEALLERLRRHPSAIRAALAGSIRRRCETSRNVDLVASSADPGSLMEAFVALPQAETIVARGAAKSSILLATGMAADLRVVRDEEFPFALLHFTGSGDHNVAMRARALGGGLKLNELGLFRGEERLPCRDEEEIFRRLELAFIPPELREGRGEIEAAESGESPALVSWEDLKGVLHVHTSASDGSATLERMAEAARDLGMTYLGVCDHSRSARYARGLDERRVEEQHRAIDDLNGRLKGMTLLKGIEADILADGSLDFPDPVLATFDFVVASVHSRFQLSEADMTRRILRALSNPYVRILGHPTGRLLLAREPYPVDISAIIRAAAKGGIAIELNANPHRLDVDWRLIPEVRAAGVRVSINPDAHEPSGIADMRHGVGIARKGGLPPGEVLNALEIRDLMKVFRR